MNLPKDAQEAIKGYSENLSLDFEHTKEKGQRKKWPKSNKTNWAEKTTEHRYKRWKTIWGKKLTVFKITAKTPILINTEGGAVDHGLALWRWCGIPWLPGSGIKGITQHGDEEKKLEIYGSTSQKGKLIFLPGLPLQATTITTGITPHPERRDPRPLPFPAIEQGSQFLLGVINPQGIKTPKIKEILETMGIGAKTTSGFGWVEIADFSEELEKSAQAEKEKRTKEALEKTKAKELAQKEAEELSTLPKLLQENKKVYVDAVNKLKEVSEEIQKEFLIHLFSLPKWGDKVGGKKGKGDTRRTLCKEVAQKLGIEIPQ